MRGQIGVGDTRADPERSRGQFLDVVEGQPGEVDEGVRGFHVMLHEVDEVGAAAEVAGAGVARVDGRRFLEAGGLYVGEGLHAITSGSGADSAARPWASATSATASATPL